MEQHEDMYRTLDQDNMEDKEVLDCPVCLESYNEGLHIPKMMPCLHTLCASCIASLTSTVTKQNTPDSQAETITPTAPLESVFRRGFLSFSSQSNVSINSNDNPGQGAASNVFNPFANVTQPNNQHPILRRISGQGPTSPTTQQPQDPLPSTRFSHVAKGRGGVSGSVKRPEISPPLPPNSKISSSSLEPFIPKDVVVQCPLCRSEVSTSKLQTNRYVLAHMRDLARLSLYSPCSSSISPWTEHTASSNTQATSHPAQPQDYYCEDCKQIAIDSCVRHQLIPLAEWVATQKAILESLRMKVEEKLIERTTYLNNLGKIIKDIYYSLNKASRYVWQANRQLEDFKEELNYQPNPTPTTHSPQEIAELLMEKVAHVERLVAQVSKENLTAGNEEVTVSLRQKQQEIFIRTNNPSTALIIRITEGHAAD